MLEKVQFVSTISIQFFFAYFRIENVIESARQLKRVHGFPVGESVNSLSNRSAINQVHMLILVLDIITFYHCPLFSGFNSL